MGLLGPHRATPYPKQRRNGPKRALCVTPNDVVGGEHPEGILNCFNLTKKSLTSKENPTGRFAPPRMRLTCRAALAAVLLSSAGAVRLQPGSAALGATRAAALRASRVECAAPASNAAEQRARLAIEQMDRELTIQRNRAEVNSLFKQEHDRWGWGCEVGVGTQRIAAYCPCPCRSPAPQRVHLLHPHE